MDSDHANRVRIVQNGEARRRSVALARGIDAYRVLNGFADRAPAGLALDRYASWLVLSVRDPALEWKGWATASIEALQPEGLVVKILRVPVSASTSSVFFGTLPAAPIRVREGDATFLCEVDSGISTGL